jgi:hypothetical protein
MTLSRSLVTSIGLSGCLMSAGCLPTDTRPPPASVLVQASADEAIRTGVTTADGWSVKFDRFLITLGRASLDGDACNPYSDARYERILDMQQPSPQKISLLYGLGQCDFSFSVVHPVWDSVVGPGVAADEALMMQTAGSDKYTAPTGQLAGVNTYVTGTAERSGVRKTFAWSFRLDFEYQGCSSGSDAGPQGLTLHGNEATTVDLLVRGETLFQTDVDATSGKLQFEPFAAADSIVGNDDGQITLDELNSIPITVSGGPRGAVDAGAMVPDAGLSPQALDAGLAALDGSLGDYSSGDGGVLSPSTLEDFVYLELFPSIVRYQDTGQCATVVVRTGRGR